MSGVLKKIKNGQSGLGDGSPESATLWDALTARKTKDEEEVEGKYEAMQRN